MRSNAYTYRFIILLTGIAALLLSMAATGLKPRQDFNRTLDTKKNILKVVDIYDDAMSADEIENSYTENIHPKYLNSAGDYINETDGLQVFIFGSPTSPKGYIFPVSGKGLWSTVKGFLALKPDLNTVQGITFYEHGETPGLGGEIEKDWFTSQFADKKIFDGRGNLVSIDIAKGKAINPTDHIVDGISGSTLTCIGVKNFLSSDLHKYINFMQKQAKN